MYEKISAKFADPLESAFSLYPEATESPLNALVNWYARRVSDWSSYDHVSALIVAAIDRISMKYDRVTQVELCELSRRPSTVLQRYFGSAENLEAVAWAISVELSLEGDLRQFAADEYSDVLGLTGAEMFPHSGASPFGDDKFRVARRTNRAHRAIGIGILRSSEVGRQLLSLLQRRLTDRAMWMAYREPLGQFPVSREDLLIRNAMTPLLATAEAVGDRGLTTLSEPRVYIEQLWWDVTRAILRCAADGQHDERQIELKQATRIDAVRKAFPDLSEKSQGTMESLSRQVSEIMDSGLGGMNDLRYEKAVQATRPTIRNYLGDGRQLLGTAGLIASLTDAMSIRDTLRSTRRNDLASTVEHIAARSSSWTYAMVAEPANEQTQHLGAAITETYAEIAESLEPLVGSDRAGMFAEFVHGMAIPRSATVVCEWLPQYVVVRTTRAAWAQVIRQVRVDR